MTVEFRVTAGCQLSVNADLPNGTSVGYACPDGAGGPCASLVTVPPVSGSMCLAGQRITIDMDCLAVTDPEDVITIKACWFTIPSNKPFTMTVTWGSSTKVVSRSTVRYTESCCDFKIAEISYRNSDKLFGIDMPFMDADLNNAINTGEPNSYPIFDAPESKTIPVIKPGVFALDVIPQPTQPNANFAYAPVISDSVYPLFDIDATPTVDVNIPHFSLDTIPTPASPNANFINAIVTSISGYVKFETETNTDITGASPPHQLVLISTYLPPSFYIFNNAILSSNENYVTFETDVDTDINGNVPSFTIPSTYVPANFTIFDNALISSVQTYPTFESDNTTIIVPYPPTMSLVPPPTPIIYVISGSVTTSGSPVINVAVSDGTTTTSTDSSGNYSIPVLPGTYNISATHSLYDIPSSPIFVDASSSDVSGVDFDAFFIPPNVYQVSGDSYYGMDGTYVHSGEMNVLDIIQDYDTYTSHYELTYNPTYKLYRNMANPNYVMGYSPDVGYWIVADISTYSNNYYPCGYYGYSSSTDPEVGTWYDYQCSYNPIEVTLL